MVTFFEPFLYTSFRDFLVSFYMVGVYLIFYFEVIFPFHLVRLILLVLFGLLLFVLLFEVSVISKMTIAYCMYFKYAPSSSQTNAGSALLTVPVPPP